MGVVHQFQDAFTIAIDAQKKLFPLSGQRCKHHFAGQNRIEVPAASNRLVPIALQLPADTDQRPGSHPIKIEVTPVNPPDQADGPSASARHEDSIFMVPR